MVFDFDATMSNPLLRNVAMSMKDEKSNQLESLLKGTDQVSIVRPNADDLGLTEKAYSDLTFAMAFFNDRLFGGTLADCILSFSRLSKVLGYFCPDRFESEDGEVSHEISLNPAYMKLLGDRESLSTLVHEMCHQWRHDHGPLNARGGKGTRGYHDKVWAGKMIEVGLMPTDTGQPGGKQTGYRISDFVIEGGQFDLDCTELLASGFRLNWHDRPYLPLPDATDDANADEVTPPKPKKKKDRIRFSCPECALNAWAKPSAKLACGTCGLIMTPSQ